MNADKVISIRPPEGAVGWAMKNGTLYKIEGGQVPWGRMVPGAGSHQDAAQAGTLYRNSSGCAWLPPGTELRVWKVIGGGIGGYVMEDQRRFIVHQGQAVELERVRGLYCCCCGGRHTGRQWFNQDTGHGLCGDCWTRILAKGRESKSELIRCYGYPGVHFDLLPEGWV